MSEKTIELFITNLPQIITAIAALVGAVFGGLGLLRSKQNAVAIEKVEKSVNGKMAELLEVTKTSSKAEGKLEEKDEQAVRDNEPKAMKVDDVVKVELVETDKR